MNPLDRLPSDFRESALRRIHENGLRALLHSIRALRENPDRPHNTSYFDCVIGSRLSSLALTQVPEDSPPAVREFLIRHHQHEMCHCAMAITKVPEELAQRISAYHEGILRQYGWPAYLACMPLTGERMALGTAFGGRFDDDPHTTVKGFLDEFHHTTYPLVLLGLYASDQQLEESCAAQERFLQLLGVPSGAYTPLAERVCTTVGRDVHEAIA